MKKRHPIAIASLLLVIAVSSPAPGASATPETMILADKGNSSWRLCIPADAVKSVRLAAEELAHYFEKATGARLPIVTEEASPVGPYISLGATDAARSVGIQYKGERRDGYRIVTHEGNLYILGLDETQPAGIPGFDNISKGTLYGVYTFLEEHLNVRWLIPGDLGEDVPTTPTLELPAIDQTFEPPMFYRIIEGIDQRTDAATVRWKLRNKCGYNRRIEHNHNWQNVVPPELFKAHPEWFAEFGGERLPPSGHYKLETTNRELRRHYAEEIRKAFRDDPARYSFSLSPTDGQGWSQSQASKALDETAPDGKLSVSPRIIEFYNGIAKDVGSEFPDRLLGAYLYDRYFYPPKAGAPSLESNLFLMIAPLQNYGFRLFRPDVRALFDAAMDGWLAKAKHWGYYDLPVTLLPNGAGVITPPCLEILEHIYKRLHEGKCEAVYISGAPAFGYGGTLNYLLAKLNWDPSLAPQKLAAEFYTRAYGAEAGKIMQELDAWWEEVFQRYYQGTLANYHITEELVESLYAPNYAALEKGYLSAHAAAAEPRHIARLEQYGKNLSILQWLLRHRGLIPEEKASPLFKTDDEIEALIANADNDPAIAPVKTFTALSRTREPRLTVAPATSIAPSLAKHERRNALFRGPTRWVLQTEEGKKPVITCTRMPLEEIVTYRITDKRGKTISSGILMEGAGISPPPGNGETYFLDIICGRAAYGLNVDECRYAVKADGRFRGKLWLNALEGRFPTLYLFPDGSGEEIEIHLSSISTNEAVAADIVDSHSQVLKSLDTSNAPLQTCRLPAPQSGEPLALVFKTAKQGVARYAFLQTKKGASAWLGLSSGDLLKVEEVRRGR